MPNKIKDGLWKPTDVEESETCLLCGDKWGFHHGWLCDKEPYLSQYLDNRWDLEKIPREYRFWTESMRLDAAAKIQSQKSSNRIISIPTTNEEPEWKKWQHRAPGECPCGIKREMCIYHK